MNIGFYAGSFDPFTNGHLHIVKSASFLFDKVFVGIGINQDKKRRYDKVLMKQFLFQNFTTGTSFVPYNNRIFSFI